jgi:hypothetical protein
MRGRKTEEAGCDKRRRVDDRRTTADEDRRLVSASNTLSSCLEEGVEAREIRVRSMLVFRLLQLLLVSLLSNSKSATNSAGWIWCALDAVLTASGSGGGGGRTAVTVSLSCAPQQSVHDGWLRLRLRLRLRAHGRGRAATMTVTPHWASNRLTLTLCLS